MAFDINWNLLTDGSKNLANAIADAGKTIATTRKRKALSNYLANPDDEVAGQRLRDRDPELYVKARSAARDEQALAAMGDYVSEKFGSSSRPPSNNALIPSPAASYAEQPGDAERRESQFKADPISAINSVPLASGAAMPQGASAQGRQPDAFARLAKAAPAAAMKARIDALKFDGDRLELADKVNAAQLKLLSGAKDQASWDRAKANAKEQFRQYGLDVDNLDVPEQFDPAWVDGRRLEAMEADKYFAELRGRKRLDWDIKDDEIDNTRADRDLDDTIGDRRERRNLTIRDQNMDSADRRRGQNMNDSRDRDNDREPTPSRVIGRILRKIELSQPLTAGEAEAFNQYKTIGYTSGGGSDDAPVAATPAPRPAAPVTPPKFARPAVGATATNPKTGKQIRWTGTGWQPVR
jgi:hypothetical protein